MKPLYVLAAVLVLTGCARASLDGSRPLTKAEDAAYERGWKSTYAWLRHAQHQCAAHGGDATLAWSRNDDGSMSMLATRCHDGLVISHVAKGGYGSSQEVSADQPQNQDAQGNYVIGSDWNSALNGMGDTSGGAEYCVDYDPDNLCRRKP
jgi:hypothetical protein